MNFLKQVIAGTRAAIANNTLLALHPHHKSCVYETDDGYRCTVGTGLSREQLGDVKANGWNQGSGVSSLVANGLIPIKPYSLEHTLLLITQELHDNWMTGGYLFADTHGQPEAWLNDFIRPLHDQLITRAHFEQWLDLVEANIP